MNWPEVYVISNQKELTMVDVLVTNIFGCFGVARQLYSDQDQNFKVWFIQEVTQHLGISKTQTTTPLHQQSDGKMEQYVKIVEEYLREVASKHQKDWDVRLPIFLLPTGHQHKTPQA
jgi:hypothetical protein